MDYLLKILLLIICSYSICCLADNDFKPAIEELKEKINAEVNTEVQSHLRLELAKLYYQDQSQERAFETFLSALVSTKKKSEPLSSVEKMHYDQALQLYIKNHEHSTESSQSIINNYATVLKQHPYFYSLGFLVASAYANLNEFSKFFDIFYVSHNAYPDHYLAFKTKAILHLKLFERAVPGNKKELHRQAFIDYLKKSSDLNPNDSSLYRLMITYAKEADKKWIVLESLNRITDGDIIVPRVDLDFYIKNAMANVNTEITQRFLNKAKTWYPFSRAIIAAQQSIDQQMADRGRDHHE